MTQTNPIAILLEAIAILSVVAVVCGGAEWAVPQIALPKQPKHPLIACTPRERARLRAAYKAAGAERRIVAAMVSRADRLLGRDVKFPPRGGQHNQWYQCDRCQLALKTLSDTRHQCPRCKKVYSGEPYDDVIFSHKHSRNLRDMLTAAWAYAITGEDKYARWAQKVLLGYAERYEGYPYHSASRSLKGWGQRSGGHLYEQTLSEASALAGTIAPAYDLIHGSPALSHGHHEAIRTGLLLPMLRNIDKNKAGKSNWQTWHNAAMLWGGALVSDAAWVRKAVADPRNGFAYQMKVSVSDDGMWYENSWGYHFYTLSAMVRIVEGARRLGIDLWPHPALKKMFTLAVDYAMPDGSLPRFGDDVHTTISRASAYLEPAWHAYRDPAFCPHLPARAHWDSVLLGRKTGKRPAAPPLKSKVFAGAGHAVLRTRGPAGLAAVITFGPYGGFHGHYDKLSFVFFGHKQELGVDPGRARSQAYRLPIHRNWYKATLSHNTVLVDTASQKPAGGKLERFAANDDYAAVVASCDKAYAGVRQRRMLCMTPTYLLVFDDLSSSSRKPRRFDWVYHSRGTSVRCEAAGKAGDLGGRYVGAEYVENVKGGTTADLVRVRLAGKTVTTYLTMAPVADTEVRTGDGVGASIFDRVPMVMVTRRGPAARFAAVLEPVAKGKRPAVKSVAVDHTDGAARITVQNGARADTIILTAKNEVTLTVGGKAVLSTK